MSVIKLAIDRQSRALCGYGGAAGRLPDLFQSNTQAWQITVVDPPETSSGDYSKVDLAGQGLRMSIGGQPTGTSGGPSPIALQDTWTWDGTNKRFTGSIALNTTAVDDYLGTAAAKPAWFELNLTDSGGRETILQISFTLRAVVDELATTVPTPTDQYYTKSEIIALFVKRLGSAGDTIVLTSPDGTQSRELGVNNDGSAQDDLFPV